MIVAKSQTITFRVYSSFNWYSLTTSSHRVNVNPMRRDKMKYMHWINCLIPFVFCFVFQSEFVWNGDKDFQKWVMIEWIDDSWWWLMIDCIDEMWLNDINRYELNKVDVVLIESMWFVLNIYNIDWVDIEYSVLMTVMHIDECGFMITRTWMNVVHTIQCVISSIDELWVDQSWGYCNSSIRHLAIGQLFIFRNQWFSVLR